jgi:hypothetical protein
MFKKYFMGWRHDSSMVEHFSTSLVQTPVVPKKKKKEKDILH